MCLKRSYIQTETHARTIIRARARILQLTAPRLFCGAVADELSCTNNYDYIRNVKYYGGHVRFLLASPANCKLYFTKIRKFTFFLITIRFISQKSIIFASRFEKRCQNSINFLNVFKVFGAMLQVIARTSSPIP